MANYGKRPINDAGQAEKQRAGVAILYGGEERLDRQPYGKKERWVDPVGNVMTLQMSQPGDPKAYETAANRRNVKHADGWVEHAKCPLRHGIQNLTPGLEREFKKMPSDLRGQCDADPKVMERIRGELHAKESCAHVEWLIASRREKEAAQALKRNEKRIADEKRKAKQDELLAMQTEIAEEQLAERKAAKRTKAEKPKAPTE